ncbi:MAG: phosphoenolpyruvate-utilizing N-terminal domain-containing protein, partial [Planctomycetota bacterium]
MADSSTEKSTPERTEPSPESQERAVEGAKAGQDRDAEDSGESSDEGSDESFPEGQIDPGGTLLRGTPVAHGLAFGIAHRKDDDLEQAQPQRLPLDRVDEELARFRRALEVSRAQLEELKTSLGGRVPEDHRRILDVHLTYLQDSAFLADVENLIVGQQFVLEAAIGK